MEKRNLLICQSGGPTSAINASLTGVIKEARNNENIGKIYGSLNGIMGIIKDNLLEISLTDEELEVLKVTPSAYLGSARYVLSKEIYASNGDMTGEYSNILNTLKENNIGYVCFIGGNDSMDTVNKLSVFLNQQKYKCNIIGVPKTIDNDLIETDHTPGYGSAIKYIATSISEIKLDTAVYSKGRVTIVEIMGRDAGWLTAGSKLACVNGLGPDLIYLPEVPFDMDSFLNDVERIYKQNKKVLVAVSEGLKDRNGGYILNSYMYNNLNDVFGHQQLGGLSTVLANVVQTKLNIPVRSIEFNLMQRCASHIASLTDLNEAENCGKEAAKQVINTTGKFVSMKRSNDEEYNITYEIKNVCEVANQVKRVPLNWIINGNDISSDYIKYALPLIQGEVKHSYENGLIKFIRR